MTGYGPTFQNPAVASTPPPQSSGSAGAVFQPPTLDAPPVEEDYDDDYDDYESSPRPSAQRSPQFSPHFFRRESDGSVKLRFNLTAEEAALIEEAAGSTPLILYMHRVLTERAKYHISKNSKAS